MHVNDGTRYSMNSRRISEIAFEEAIEAALLRHGPDDVAGVREPPVPYGDAGMRPSGYNRREPEDYDRALCLLPCDVLDFVLATQPKEWKRLSQHYGAEVKEQFLRRLSSEIERRGTLDVLRRGVKDRGCAFRLAYFPPVQRAQRGNPPVVLSELFSLWSVRFDTAPGTRKASIWCCF